MAEAQLLQTLGRWPELASYCADMRERAVRIGWEAGPAMADRLEAERLLAAGEPAAAVGLAAASAERFAAIGAEWEAAVSRLPLADALLSLGRHADAAAALAQAEAALRRAGAIADLERFAALSSRIGSGADDGQGGGRDEDGGQGAVDPAGEPRIAE
jgi:hypothetical protein